MNRIAGALPTDQHRETENRRMPDRRLVLLTDGHSDPITAKTAVCLLRYCPEDVIAVLDRSHAGKTAFEVLGVGEKVPVVASLDDAAAPTGLVIGIAPSGGRIPSHWRPILVGALRQGIEVISGLHEFLADDPQFRAAAAEGGAPVWDVRRNDELDVARGQGIRPDCFRVLTVGQDCSVGKMVVAVELDRALRRQGIDSHFIATGQTGIMVSGDGCPVDRVISDFLAGAVEKLLLRHQHHEVLLFEGQGNIAHPKYSAVTLGLMHGCRPQAMVFCYEAGRTATHGMDYVPLTPMEKLIPAYEMMANLVSPGKIVGIAANTRRLTAEAARSAMQRVEDQLQLPTCDVLRDGPEVLVQALLRFRETLMPR